MRRWGIRFCVAISVCLIGFAANAVTYYVCDNSTTCNSTDSGWSTGSDGNNGTSKSTPWLTLDHAGENVGPGDTIICGTGTYGTSSDDDTNTVMWITTAGSQGSPITLTSQSLHGCHVNCPTQDRGIRFDSRFADDWIVDGLQFSQCDTQAIDMKDNDDQSPYTRANRIILRNLWAHDVGQGCFYMQECDDCEIYDTLCHDLTDTGTGSQYHGIYISDCTDNWKVYNNVVHGVFGGWPLHVYDGHGRCASTNGYAHHNSLINESPQRDGGIVAYGTGHLFEYNYMWDLSDAPGYFGCFYNFGTINSTVQISNNTCSSMDLDPPDSTVLCENGCTGTQFGNVLGFTDWASVFTDPGNEDYSLIGDPGSGGPGMPEVESTRTAGASSDDITTLTISNAVVTGANRGIAVFLSNNGDNAVSPTSVTFNGSETFTEVRSVGNVNDEFELWYLVNPSNVTADIVMTLSGSNTNATLMMAAVILSGVDQSQPTLHDGNNSVFSEDLTSTVDKTLFLTGGRCNDHNSTWTHGTGQDELADFNQTGEKADSMSVSYEIKTPAGAETLTSTPSLSCAVIDYIAVGIEPAAGGGGGSGRRREANVGFQ